MSQKTIPLSLHTRRVVSVFAEYLSIQHNLHPIKAVSMAFELLGYPPGTTDPHGLQKQVVADVWRGLEKKAA
jgi:hypothetical protein